MIVGGAELALLLCGGDVVFEWWGQVWLINISGGPDAGLAWKCFLHINNAAFIWRGRRAWLQYSKGLVSGEQVKRRGPGFVIKPQTDPSYPWEVEGYRGGNGDGTRDDLVTKLCAYETLQWIKMPVTEMNCVNLECFLRLIAAHWKIPVWNGWGVLLFPMQTG